MNQAIKQQWIKALRSGGYQQGRESLCNNGKFCCLGVLTDLFIKETSQQWDHDAGGYYSFETQGGILPLSVQQWAGLDEPNPYLAGYHASDWNDIEGASFEKLADLIEEHL
jgi:hypothetical protein